MKVKELIALLSQFDPERNVWVIYDDFQAFPAVFAPISEDEAKRALHWDNKLQPETGDLAVIVG